MVIKTKHVGCRRCIINGSILFPVGLEFSEQLISLKTLADKGYKFISQKNIYILTRGSKDLQDFRVPSTLTKVEFWMLFNTYLLSVSSLLLLKTQRSIMWYLSLKKVEQTIGQTSISFVSISEDSNRIPHREGQKINFWCNEGKDCTLRRRDGKRGEKDFLLTDLSVVDLGIGRLNNLLDPALILMNMGIWVPGYFGTRGFNLYKDCLLH